MKYGLSDRVQIKIIRMARTISDMRGEQSITDVAIEEGQRDRHHVPLRSKDSVSCATRNFCGKL
ncbi:MAG: hypothetical protein ACQEXB_09285 [Bacillota bacterium]